MYGGRFITIGWSSALSVRIECPAGLVVDKADRVPGDAKVLVEVEGRANHIDGGRGAIFQAFGLRAATAIPPAAFPTAGPICYYRAKHLECGR